MKASLRYAVLGLVAASHLASSALARAEPTLELYIRDAEEVLRGDPVSTSIDAEGRVELGLVERRLDAGAGGPVVALAPLDEGYLLGTAGSGLLHLRPGAGAQVLEPASGLVVSAVAAVGGDRWFAATSPNGRILRGSGPSSEPFLDPEPAYVWDLLPESQDRVLAVTGAPAQLLRVEKGRGTVVFAPKETHLRSIARHPARGLVLGGGQKGIVYQVDEPSGRARALYDSELEEVTAFASDPKTGDLFVAVVSGTQKGSLDPGTWIGPVADEADEAESPIKGSEVVRIRDTGEVDRLFSSKNEGALALAFEAESGRLFIATGTGKAGRARIYAVETRARDRVVLLARLPPPMGTALYRTPRGALVVATAPDGAVYELGPRTRSEGEYLSVEQDLGRVARIGRLWFDAAIPKGAKVEISIRTGNTETPDETWSEFGEPVSAPKGGPVEVPRGRYAQLKARLVASPRGESPVLRSMHASVRRVNLAPELLEVFPLRQDLYLKQLPPESETEKTISLTGGSLDELRRPERDTERLRVRAGQAPGQRTIAWRVRDANGDDLLFWARLERMDGARFTLGEAIEVPFVTFDARAYPDGRYFAYVRVSDRPTNAPGEALEDERRSEVLLIDHTAPKIARISAGLEGRALVVRVEAQDELSRLSRAEVSLDGGPWVHLPAEDGLIDAHSERFVLSVERPTDIGGRAPGTGPHVVKVRVEDEAGNLALGSASAPSN